MEETFGNLAAFLNSLDAEGEQKFELSHSLVIICPDCGKNIAFRGRCPKCAGNSWVPAGHAGGIFEKMKAQRLRRMISSPDDTGTMRQQLDAASADADETVRGDVGEDVVRDARAGDSGASDIGADDDRADDLGADETRR